MKNLRFVIPATVVFISSVTLTLMLNRAEGEIARINKQLSMHGLDKSLLLESVPDESMLTGLAASQMISNAPDYREGPSSILNRETIDKIKSMKGVIGVYAISSSTWKLQTSTKSADVTLYGVAPEFLEAYKFLPEGKLLNLPRSRKTYIGEQLSAGLGINSTASVELVLRDAAISTMPDQMRNSVNWSAMKQPINIEPLALNLPKGVPMFENGIFSQESLSKISVGTLHIVPAIRVFVLTDSPDTARTVQSQSQSFKPAQAGHVVKAKMFSDYIAGDIQKEAVDNWNLLFIIVSGTILAFMAMISPVANLRQMREEVALRFAFGTNKNVAVWRTIRGLQLYSVSGAILALVLSSAMAIWSQSTLSVIPILIIPSIMLSGVIFHFALGVNVDPSDLLHKEQIG